MYDFTLGKKVDKIYKCAREFSKAQRKSELDPLMEFSKAQRKSKVRSIDEKSEDQTSYLNMTRYAPFKQSIKKLPLLVQKLQTCITHYFSVMGVRKVGEGQVDKNLNSNYVSFN